MRLIIDIGHPGHVHYFKNLYWNLKAHGHNILIFARDKEVSFKLLHHYKMPFISRGKGRKSLVGKLIFLLYASTLIYRLGHKFKPDLIISFSSPYASLAAFFLRCPNIILDDTEVGRFERCIYKPLANLIITPKAFKMDLGSKHFRFDGFMELSYLLPAYFQPEPRILDDLGINNKEKFVIIRFVSWEASHDKGQKGLSLRQKHEIINLCKRYARIYISSEMKLPDSLEEFRLKIQPHKLHDALHFAAMYIGEGATTASEACLLGTPAVYINTITAGTIEEQERSGLLLNFREFKGVAEQISKILVQENKDRYVTLSKKMIGDKIDLTAFLTWLVENYPDSARIMREEPEYQLRFK